MVGDTSHLKWHWDSYFFFLYDHVVVSFKILIFLSLLVVVVNRLTSWRCHHDGLSLGLHCSVDVAKYSVAHHVHHRVHTACKLLWHRLHHRLLHHWLLRHHNLLGLKHVYELWVVEVIHQIVQLHLTQALGLQEVLDLV